MRKIFALATLMAAVIASVYFSACKDKKAEPKADVKEDSLKKVVERGEYLTLHVAMCIDCHSERDFSKYSGPVIPSSYGKGGEVFDEKLGVPGVVYARNITSDSETGIGTWTDEDILKAVTQGISKRGDTLFPIMPYYNYTHMAKEDLMSIVAYIKTLKPIKNKVADRKLMVPISVIYQGNLVKSSVDSNVRPPQSDLTKYGEYMTMFSACVECHTPMTKQGPDMSRAFSGGFLFDLPPFKVTSANITPDSATGLGTWSQAQFVNKFSMYREEKSYNFDPGKNNTYMPVTAYAGMKDEDLAAIYAYLRTLPPASNKVEKYPK